MREHELTWEFTSESNTSSSSDRQPSSSVQVVLARVARFCRHFFLLLNHTELRGILPKATFEKKKKKTCLLKISQRPCWEPFHDVGLRNPYTAICKRHRPVFFVFTLTVRAHFVLFQLFNVGVRESNGWK